MMELKGALISCETDKSSLWRLSMISSIMGRCRIYSTGGIIKDQDLGLLQQRAVLCNLYLHH